MFKHYDLMSLPNLFITATNTDVGKTYACKVLIEYLSQQGLRVGYFKPIETGVTEYPLDGSAMFDLVKSYNTDFKTVSIEDIVPYQFALPAAPFVAKQETMICKDVLLEKKAYLETRCDILLIEGAGGLMVPIEKEYFMIDLIADFKTPALLVVPSQLGSINDTLLSLNALKQWGITHEWVVNLFRDKENFPTITQPYYQSYFDTITFLQDFLCEEN